MWGGVTLQSLLIGVTKAKLNQPGFNKNSKSRWKFPRGMNTFYRHYVWLHSIHTCWYCKIWSKLVTSIRLYHYFVALLFFRYFCNCYIISNEIYFSMEKHSVPCDGVTALVYSSASISDPKGLAVTCWHHFIHLVENERRVPCNFMILSHLAKFLSLLVCLTPRAWKTENMLLCTLSPSVYMCYKHLHKNICLHTKILVYVGVCDPWVLALA